MTPQCPHCGERRRVAITAESETTDTLVEAQRWECAACAGVFWMLPTLATRS